MAKLIEFRKKYDFLQDEFRKCYDEREILMNTIRKFEATKPEAYDSSGAISLAVCVFTVSFCIIDNHYSGPMFILLWLILLTVIVGLTKAWITYQKYCTEIELKDWEQNTKPKIIHLVQNINNNTFKTRTISQSLKEFAIDLHTHIKTFRTNINISTNQLRKFTYFINQYVLQGGKHYYEREWSDNWGIKYYINSWDFGTLKIYSYSSSPNYNYKNIIHDILVEIDETVDSNKETIRKEKELRLISKLKYNIKNQIGEQVKQLRKQINKEITSTNLGLDIEKQYELREALVKIRLRQDVNWLRNNGMSEEFIVATSDNWEAREQKKLANHSAFEGRIKYSDKEKIKKSLGYNCMACGKNMEESFGDIGKGYIELHHKIPYADMKENEERVLKISDFYVLCPNCHRMIHKLDDAGDIELLKNIIDFNRKQEKSRRSTDNTVDSNDNTNTANGDTSIDLSFSEKESTNMSKKQDKANQKERTRENIDKINISISPEDIASILKQPRVTNLTQKRSSFVRIETDMKRGKILFIIGNSRLKQKVEASINAIINTEGIIVTNISFCNIISKLSHETIIKETDKELVIESGETKYKLPLLK